MLGPPALVVVGVAPQPAPLPMQMAAERARAVRKPSEAGEQTGVG
jgi:hypothetical protein